MVTYKGSERLSLWSKAFFRLLLNQKCEFVLKSSIFLWLLCKEISHISKAILYSLLLRIHFVDLKSDLKYYIEDIGLRRC